MSYGFKAGLLVALAIFAAPVAVNAYPAAGPGSQNIAQTPIVKADCCGCCDGGCPYPRCDYWRPRYYGYWRPHYYGWYGNGGYYGHSRYWSHYRWGSYQRYWRPYEGGEWGY